MHKMADAQNGRRTKPQTHKTEEGAKRHITMGNPPLIKAGGINKFEKILILCTLNDPVGWHCHNLISMDQENIPPDGILAEFVTNQIFWNISSSSSMETSSSITLGGYESIYVKYHVVVYVICVVCVS
jgi:hypothetical protein